MKRNARRVLAALALASMVAMIVFASAMPVAAQFPSAIMSEWAEVIPRIDGVFDPGEWDDAARVDFQQADPANPLEAYLYFKNDADNMYILVDFVGDTTQGCWGWCLALQQLTGSQSQSPWEDMEGFGPSPNSAIPHMIFEMRLGNDPSFFEFRPGERFNFGMAVLDCDTNQWDQFPTHLAIPDCEPTGAVVLARQYYPVPSVTLWGTVGLAVALGGLVIWHLRRRATKETV